LKSKQEPNKIFLGLVLKGCINIQNLFKIQYGINPRPYLETLIIEIILYGYEFLTAMDVISRLGNSE